MAVAGGRPPERRTAACRDFAAMAGACFPGHRIRFSALEWPMTDRSGRSSRASPREWPQVRRSRLELAVVPAAVRIARVWTAEQLGRPTQGYERADADVIDSAVLRSEEHTSELQSQSNLV